jgi:hypothetical protein
MNIVKIYDTVFVGTVLRDFRHLWLFSPNNPIWAPDSRVKDFSNMASNSRRYSTKSGGDRCIIFKKAREEAYGKLFDEKTRG